MSFRLGGTSALCALNAGMVRSYVPTPHMGRQRRQASAALAAVVLVLAALTGAVLLGTPTQDAMGPNFVAQPVPRGTALRGVGGVQLQEKLSPSVGESSSTSSAGTAVFCTMAGVLLLATSRLNTGRGSAIVRQAEGKTPLEKMKVGDKVDGKVSRVARIGIWVDVGAEKDALWPIREVPKDKEIKVGDSIPGLTISEVSAGTTPEERRIRVTTFQGIDMASLQVGQAVEGTVSAVNENVGMFLDNGTRKDALMRTNQLEKAISDYKVGDVLKNLRVSSVNAAQNKVEVSSRKLPSEVSKGEMLEGTVIRVSDFGVFFDAGLAQDVLAPERFLPKPVKEYTVNEIADLVVVDVKDNRVTVSAKVGDEAASPLSGIVRGNEVKGKILRKESWGLFIDFGSSTDALLREKSLPKPISEYNVGDELDNLYVFKVDEARGQVELKVVGFVGDVGTALTDISVGDEATGKVKRITNFGIFLDVGAERDALWPIKEVPKDKYKEGDEVTGLRFTEADPSTNRLSVTINKMAMDFKEGDKVKGTIMKVQTYGVFVDIGACMEALAPARLLSLEPGSYNQGQLLNFEVDSVDAANNKLTVRQEGVDAPAGGGGGAGKYSMQDLKKGDKIKGIVKASVDFGVFVDIGLGRRDALLPNGLMGGVNAGDLKPGQQIDVYIAQVDVEKERVSLSLSPPSSSAIAGMGGEGDPPKGFMDVNTEYYKTRYGEYSIPEEPIDWKAWEKKFPGICKHTTKEVELYMCVSGTGWNGLDQSVPAQRLHIPIPAHLRKDDAETPEILQGYQGEEDWNVGDSYESGIKPEIHTKYRQPPFNDPNWTFNAQEG